MKKTLKELREKKGLTQADVAKTLNITISAVSHYEFGEVPPLEKMVIMELNFGERIEWPGDVPSERDEIVRSLLALLCNYPISAVLTFAQKALNVGQSMGEPGKLINFYAEQAGKLDIEPLLPPKSKN